VEIVPVRQVLAMLLLTCLGLMLPAAAVPVRLCLLDFTLFSCSVVEDGKCCPDCEQGETEPASCCLDLEGLPDASSPDPSIELPQMIGSDLSNPLCGLQLAETGDRTPFRPSAPIRGPSSPSAHRAVLGIWRI
jgi:hypothetical protein